MKRGIQWLVWWMVVSMAVGCQTGQQPIVIGGGFNLTGGLSSLDVPAANGANLAIKQINAQGGVLGRQLSLKIVDGRTDIPTIRSTTTELVEREKIRALIGFTDSDSVLAAGAVTAKTGIPFITVGATSPSLPAQLGPSAFLASFGDNVQAAAGAQFAYQTLNYRTAYLLWDKGTEYTKLLGSYFKQSWQTVAGADALVGEDTYQFKDADHSAQIARIKALPRQPDFLYIAANPDDIGPIVKEFRAAGLSLPILGGDGYDTPDLVRIAGDDANNVFFSTHALVESSQATPEVKQFITAYTQEYGAAPENAFAALGYDTMYLLADAIKRANSVEPGAITKALEATQHFPGVTGQISFSAASHVPQKGVTIIAVKNKQFTLGAQVVPEHVPAP